MAFLLLSLAGKHVDMLTLSRLVKYISLVAVFVPYSSSQGIGCPPCEKNPCDVSKAINCRGGTTTDACGCCLVCARIEGETCGGRRGEFGSCDTGFYCKIEESLDSWSKETDKIGHCAIDVGDVATNELDCRRVRCTVPTVEQLDCPGDSFGQPGAHLVGECCPSPARCVCKEQCPPQPICSPGSEAKLVRAATNAPGTCCDLFKCEDNPQQYTDCTGVVCPPGSEPSSLYRKEQLYIKCPSDSVYQEKFLTHNGCCTHESRCLCNSSCPATSCPVGHMMQLTANGSDEPGSCCSTFSCENKTSVYCLASVFDVVKLVAVGDSWQKDACTTCHCLEGGERRCHVEQCKPDFKHCSWGGFLANSTTCCPVCRGCKTPTGLFVEEGKEWLEDECTTCQCEKGQPRCLSQACSVTCLNPRRLPAHCCPVCDEPTLIPDTCQPMNCSLSCPHGLQIGTDACPICRCQPAECRISCPAGLAVDEDNQPVCRCLPQKLCPELAECTRKCPYGRMQDEDNCDVCACKRCPQFKCLKVCPFGYEENTRGCLLCKCKAIPSSPIPEVSTTSVPSAPNYPITINPVPTSDACMTDAGRVFLDGELWHDGCRTCACLGGRELCTLVHCPVPKCLHPWLSPGHCCPSCEDEVVRPVPAMASSTLTCESDGVTYVDGEQWRVDACTRCLCYRGEVMCESQPVCRPALCRRPHTPLGQCCPRCSNEEETPSSSRENELQCSQQNGLVYESGESWRESPCLSSICEQGRVRMYKQRCPVLRDCRLSVIKKGDCCSSCIETEEHKPIVMTPITLQCRDANQVYSDGEIWQPTDAPCVRCVCVSGNRKCHQLNCPPTPCPASQTLATVPGFCCKICRPINITSPYDVGQGKGEDDGSYSHGIHKATIVALVVIGVVLLVLMPLLIIVVCRQQRFVLALTKHLEATPRRETMACRTISTCDPLSAPLVIPATGTELGHTKDSCSCKLCVDDDVKARYPPAGASPASSCVDEERHNMLNKPPI